MNLGLQYQNDRWICLELAGLLQQQQMAGRPTTMEDRTRIMYELLKKNKYGKMVLLEKTYILSGMVLAQDGTKVLPFVFVKGMVRVVLVVVVVESKGKRHIPCPTLSQENFRKGASGLLSLVEIGLDKAVIAVTNLEKVMGGKLALGVFRGAENLIPPDAMVLLPIAFFEMDMCN